MPSVLATAAKWGLELGGGLGACCAVEVDVDGVGVDFAICVLLLSDGG